MIYENLINKYFFLLIVLLPISIIIGPGVSLFNILLFDISFLVLVFIKKEFKWINNFYVKLLLGLYLYLIINSFLSLDPNLNFLRNFGFLRLIIFFVGLNYFFYKYPSFDKIFLIWIIIIFIVSFDVFFEKIFGQNILGFQANNLIESDRIVSFFFDEPIVGSFIYGFFFTIIGYYISKFKNSFNFKNFFYIILFISFFFISVVITGERSNTIKFLISLIFFTIFFKVSIKKKFYIFFSIVIFLFFTIMSNDYLKVRFNATTYAIHTYLDIFNDPFGKGRVNPYASLNRSGYEIFKKYPFFGVGNKNYRLEACKQNLNKLYICDTHPHQIYFELLAEHGINGTFIILSIIFFIFFKNLFSIIKNREYISVGCLAYLIAIFLPMIPSGAFFNNYNLNLFFINLSVMMACNKNMNIFNVKQ